MIRIFKLRMNMIWGWGKIEFIVYENRVNVKNRYLM
jgi:hypothetical protein